MMNTLQVAVDPNFRIQIIAAAMEKIRNWVDLAKGEVSGLGLVEKVDCGFCIQEVFLPKQQCSSASTEIEAEDVSALMYEVDQLGFDAGKLRFWWHSHVNMECFWSATDQNQHNLFGADNWFISTVVNKRRDSLTRVDIYNPIRIGLDRVSLEVITDLNTIDACKAEFNDKVKEAVRSTVYSGAYTGYSGGDYWSKTRQKVYPPNRKTEQQKATTTPINDSTEKSKSTRLLGAGDDPEQATLIQLMADSKISWELVEAVFDNILPVGDESSTDRDNAFGAFTDGEEYLANALQDELGISMRTARTIISEVPLESISESILFVSTYIDTGIELVRAERESEENTKITESSDALDHLNKVYGLDETALETLADPNALENLEGGVDSVLDSVDVPVVEGEDPNDLVVPTKGANIHGTSDRVH
jgi:hypothetical protein